MELNNFQNIGSKKNNIENETPSVDGSRNINIENDTPSVEIEGPNEVNGTNCCYGHLWLLQNKKKVDDLKNRRFKKVNDNLWYKIVCKKIWRGVSDEILSRNRG